MYLSRLPVSAEDRCAVAKDFMFQALEQIKSGSRDEVENGLQLLKHANEQCPSQGDAWYYRSLFERKLNQPADYSLSKAKMFHSEKMAEGVDPFRVATAPQDSLANQPIGPVRQKWALVIGISKFADTRVPHLNYASKDARDFAAALEDRQVGRFHVEDVHVVLDSDATTKRIKSELNWLARSAQPDDLVVVFVSTHGSPRQMDTRNVNYLVTSDTEIKPQDALFATALGMVELSEVVRSRILARRTIILLDTCHSGAALPSRVAEIPPLAVSTATLDSIRQGVGRAILTASQAGERSYEDDDAHNGFFTHYLVQALRQSKGLDSISKVYEYVRGQVSQNVKARLKLSQNPALSLSDQGPDIVLGIAAAASASP